MGEIKHRIGIGQSGDDVTASSPPVVTSIFTADSTLILASNTTRTADETN